MPTPGFAVTVTSVAVRTIAITRLGLVLGTALLAASCNSDEKPRSATDETTEDGGTTEETDTGTEESTDTGPPPDKTCRDGVACIFACAAEYPMDPGPEDPALDDFFLACFLECGQDLTAEEALALIRLVSCVSDICYGNGSCSSPGGDTGTDSTTGDPADCQLCLGGNLLQQNPGPEGCEEESDNCT